MSAETVRATPEGRLRWFSEHDAERDAARAERDVARADLADLRARIAALADEMDRNPWDVFTTQVRALLVCPTCGGTAWVDWTDDHPGGLCPDCTKETP